MKIILLALLLLSTTANAQKIQDDESSLKILTLNTWLIPFLRKMHKTRGKMIGEEIRNYDVSLLQEVFLPADRGRIIKNLHRGGERFHNRYESNKFFKLNPGLFNISRHKIIRSSFLTFSRCLDEQCYVKKGALHTRVQLPSGLEVDIYNTHLQPFKSGRSVRLSQIQELIKFIDQTNNSKRPVILAGDLNTSNDDLDMLATLKDNGFRDTWVESNGPEGGDTWNSFINTWSQKLDGDKFSKARFDFIFVRGTKDVDVVIESTKLACDNAMEYSSDKAPIFMSDHFGVETIINFRE